MKNALFTMFIFLLIVVAIPVAAHEPEPSDEYTTFNLHVKDLSENEWMVISVHKRYLGAGQWIVETWIDGVQVSVGEMQEVK